MSSIIYHDECCPFDFRDWTRYDIEKLYAGNDCVMAITYGGQVLQKVVRNEYAAMLFYWNNIKSISISQLFPALAVGLIADGTCVIAKRPLIHCCEVGNNQFEAVYEQLKRLRNIVEIVVSDAIFALDRYGKVHHISLWREDDYVAVEAWSNIKHIVAGNQNSVFGITNSGSVLCAGANTICGPYGDLNKTLQAFHNVVDICAMGSECEKPLLALSDGRIVDMYGETIVNGHVGTGQIFTGNHLFTVAKMKNEKYMVLPYDNAISVSEKLSSTSNVRSIAVGSIGCGYPAFCVWR
ncbi:MAG: hypothetical protein E7331_08115 [Clostridiales bacterium]|nr:hypothetical protein [Clostridiales bacterium]